MLSEPDDIMAVFRGTVLDGHAVTPASGSDVLLVSWPDPKDLLPAWRAARDAMGVTGRRPLFLTDEFGPLPAFPQVSSEDLARIDAAARTMDPWSSQLLAYPPDEEAIDAQGLTQAVDTVLRRGWLGRPPRPAVLDLIDELSEAIPLPTTDVVIEQWLFHRIAADPLLAARLEDPAGKGQSSLDDVGWFVPTRVQLALLPATSAWLPMVWHSLFDREDDQVLAACLWQWNQAYGAELVASWGTMLQFVVERRPVLGPAAWALAGQQLAVGPTLQESQFALAWILSLSDTWFVHSRP